MAAGSYVRPLGVEVRFRSKPVNLEVSTCFRLDVPSTTVAATVQINVKPSKGAVLLYTGPSYDKPIRFPGPSSTRVLPTSSRTVRIELVEGAKSFRVKILGRIDGLDGSKIEPPSR